MLHPKIKSEDAKLNSLLESTFKVKLKTINQKKNYTEYYILPNLKSGVFLILL